MLIDNLDIATAEIHRKLYRQADAVAVRNLAQADRAIV